jgi:hypothetical protein
MAVVNPNNYVTPTEVENNYEFKLMKKVLRQEYPWVLDVLVPNDEEINKYNLIFLPIVIDPFILQKEVGLPIEAWIKRYLTDERYKQTYRQYAYVSSYISTMFKGDRDIPRDLQERVDIIMKSVGRSAAIPNNLKIGKGRQFSSGEYIIPEMDIPEDAYFVGDEPMTS